MINQLIEEFVLQKVWKYSSKTETHTIETHIHRLRKKISQKFKDKNFIKNDEKRILLFEKKITKLYS